ncbi:MAG: molecular chaperone [Sphingomonadaceae bacterium]|nr:MAG: molecular chaperone [Sphingomonadaceae bacterium]
MKRFWNTVSVEPVDGGWQVMLDGRGVRTQGQRAQIVSQRKLADLLAAEWEDQGEEIDPATFVHRDMADYAIDMIATGEEDIVAKLLVFLETDTLCYRADPDEPLYRRQLEVWEPIVTRFEARENLSIERASGIVHRAQPEPTLATMRTRVAAIEPMAQAALFALTSLSASLIIGLEALEGDEADDTLWDAANLEEDWQVELWGEDAEAAARRAKRRAEFRRALVFAKAARG